MKYAVQRAAVHGNRWLPADSPEGTKEISSLSACPVGNSRQGSQALVGPPQPSAGRALLLEGARGQLWAGVSFP